jgi:Rod binding domain-containing protein
MDLATAPVDIMRGTDAVHLGAVRKSGFSRTEMEAKAKDFESVFMAQMLKPMWEGVETDPVFGGGTGEDVMRDMLVQEYGKAMAASDNFGLSKDIMSVMIRIQEQAQGGNV